ncbi:MAG: DUF5058 family protein [Pygmaiobacter sp.]
MDILNSLNSLPIYLICGSIVLFVALLCIVFMVKSYRAGIALGMDKVKLRRAITSSATFTVLPSISILLGVVALSGTLGIPLPWMRLSVVGALQYEANVADIAARALGLSGLSASEMTVQAFTTIGLVMTVGIMWGVLCNIFGLKKYLAKIRERGEKAKGGRSFGDHMFIAMFIGLVSAYLGSYIGVFTSTGNLIPLIAAAVAAAVMGIFVYLTEVRKMAWLDNFSIATSMLAGMAGAVLANLWL